MGPAGASRLPRAAAQLLLHGHGRELVCLLAGRQAADADGAAQLWRCASRSLDGVSAGQCV